MIDVHLPFRLDGRTAIVTGASSGLGARFALVLGAAGATVVVTARRADRLEAVAEALPGSIVVAGDITSERHLDAVVGAAIDRTGRIDVVVNNAGAVDRGPAEDEPMDRFRGAIDVNLTAAFALSQLAARHMIAAGAGSIINVASVLGLVGVGQIPQAGYAASKGGLINLTRELAAQWARKGVRVNALCPGWFHTEMTSDMFADEGAMRWIERKVPMGRGGDGHELDGALLYLASDAASYTTGQTLAVDGGYTAV